MAKLTPDQVRKRERAESVIRLVSPVLSIVLAAGERLSRIVESDDPEYFPARVEGREPVGVTVGREGAHRE